MPVSPAQQAKRDFIKVLQNLAKRYKVNVHLTLKAIDADIKRAFRKVAVHAHPDKGGCVADTQRLLQAKEAWEKAAQASTVGRPSQQATQTEQCHKSNCPSRQVKAPNAEPKAFRINSSGVLLTYQGAQDLQQWDRFVRFVKEQVVRWKVKYWCATMEACKKPSFHIHLFLQFHYTIDRFSRSFSFESLVPNGSCNDLLGEGFCKRKLQESLNRGFFYCWADKIGTVKDENGNACVAGNYFPAWTSARCTYAVKGRWAESLWQSYKLSNDVYEEYLFKCRDGTVYRKRTLDVCRSKELQGTQDAEIAARVKRIKQNTAVYKPFPPVPIAQDWLKTFQEDRLRYPLLLVFGPSAVGKTEWAKSLFANPLKLLVGDLPHFPAGMRNFQRGLHDGIVLDDVRDFAFLVKNQEKIQGKYDALVEFASTPGGALAYTKDLFAVPIVVTTNNDTANRELLQTSDWLRRPENVVRVDFPPAAP